MTTPQYFEKINKRFQSGISTEHSYRSDLQLLLESVCSNADVTNEPTRIACGAPDYIITKQGNANFPIGYIEAKDLLESLKLDAIEKTEQLVRYRASLSNLILTNYIDFRFFINGEKVTDISLARFEGKKLVPIKDNWSAFENLIKDFAQFKGISIKSAPKLAEMMASKARLMQNVLQEALESDEKTQANSSLKDQMLAFKNILIHDIKPEEFADIYAQTIAYGMFAARLHDSSMDSFTRQEAAELIPKTNPFLKKLFGYIAGVEIDDRIIWIVDALAEVFRVADVAAILKNFGKATKMEDPMIHFYETFLAAYSPKLRKSRGVWYTPEPVVNFIVRAVDDILKKEFGLPMGLADNSKIKIKRIVTHKATPDKRSKIKDVEIEEEVHKVQILDPATGTGTFLAEVIRQVYSNFEGQEGIWSKYAEDHLIPRLHGFELLMASYAMAHLKLDLLLKETGYKPTKKENRLRVYLTNSLEEAHPDANTLFASWLSQEATEANNIKRETPVMVVIGNPPYSGISQNNGEWISTLIEDYKYIDGEHFNERKHWLQDDYVKFIRYGQHFIEKNGEGILAFINNHSFLDNPTFRGMRWSLANCFNLIYILDLHGNSLKSEIPPDSMIDKNVFDIKAGVSINIFIKTKTQKKNELAEILHYDLWGSRNDKNIFLTENSIDSIPFESLTYQKPYLFFIPKQNGNLSEKYLEGFKLNDLFLNGVIGTQTGNDKSLTAQTKEKLKESIKNEFNVEISDSFIQEYQYRPFETRFMFFIESLMKNAHKNVKIPASYRSRYNTTKHLLKKNVALLFPRQISESNYRHCYVSSKISDACLISNKTKEQNQVFPLFLYSDNLTEAESKNVPQVEPNFEAEIIKNIISEIGATFLINQDLFSKGENKEITPIDIIDFIYAVLHNPSYCSKYKEFLKIDFPRIPYPKSLKTFRKLTTLGGKLRQIHLLEDLIVNQPITKYPITGDNIVTKSQYDANKVYINNTQYFEGISETVWDFYIGGYQPAQKWLKDRKGRTLSFEDIMHYQKIIVALAETDRLMKEIEKIEIE